MRKRERGIEKERCWLQEFLFVFRDTGFRSASLPDVFVGEWIKVVAETVHFKVFMS